jgi:hypothetical protein
MEGRDWDWGGGDRNCGCHVVIVRLIDEKHRRSRGRRWMGWTAMEARGAGEGEDEMMRKMI